jgi:hypothetical protein
MQALMNLFFGEACARVKCDRVVRSVNGEPVAAVDSVKPGVYPYVAADYSECVELLETKTQVSRLSIPRL